MAPKKKGRAPGAAPATHRGTRLASLVKVKPRHLPHPTYHLPKPYTEVEVLASLIKVKVKHHHLPTLLTLTQATNPSPRMP